LEILATAIIQEKETKGIQIGKEKLSLFADGMILYLRDPKNPTKKLLEVISSFDKVAGYKISTQKPIAFLYTNNIQTKREIRETNPFTIASKTINLIKESKVLFNEN
jgi:hypothetical protein